ncbi:MAG: 2'-deoxycytidine 5'-triphosphate deaminase [Myxococcales bacterium]|nr:2'-deoxycytidine 5'-triphosphate deaminase [Myxococcales bacterium]
MSAGILVSQTLRSMVTSGEIRLGRPLVEGQIQPSSLDLRVGARLWQLQCSFLPGPEGIESKLNRLATAEYRFDHDEPVVLHQGGVYLAELEEGLALPDGVWGRGNPKSSTGRLDVFVRLLTLHGEAFDTVPEGYRGPLFLEITPQSFHVKIRRGDTLGQLRLARGRPGLSAEALERWQQSQPVCSWSDGSPAPVIDAAPPGVLLQVDLLAACSGPVGYMARRHQPPVDLRDRGLSVPQYWTPLHEHEGGQVLEPEQFYIFATRERLRIPPELCAELVAFDATKGELRTHYAGFIDSGFGWSADGSIDGARLVLEIRTHDLPFLLEHGQALFRVEFMANEAIPESLYGQSSNNYQGQGLRLAKQFGH